MYKIACQTIVFGDTIKENIETILPAVKKMGYDGVEIGVRHFDKEKPDYYRDLLKKNELELLAIHVGGNFLEPDSVQKQIDQFGDTLRFACELGIHYIFISGFHKKGKTEEDLSLIHISYSLMSGADDVFDNMTEFTITYLVAANSEGKLEKNVFSTGAGNGNNFKNSGFNMLIDRETGNPDVRLFGGTRESGNWDANQA